MNLIHTQKVYEMCVSSRVSGFQASSVRKLLKTKHFTLLSLAAHWTYFLARQKDIYSTIYAFPFFSTISVLEKETNCSNKSNSVCQFHWSCANVSLLIPAV